MAASAPDTFKLGWSVEPPREVLQPARLQQDLCGSCPGQHRTVDVHAVQGRTDGQVGGLLGRQSASYSGRPSRRH